MNRGPSADSFLVQLEGAVSATAANKARWAMTEMFKLAIRHGALPVGANPFLATDRADEPGPNFIELDAGQVALILQLIAAWTGTSHYAPRNVQRIIDAILLVLGTSARIGEVLAIRFDDVRRVLVTDPDGTDRVAFEIYIGGTIVRDKVHGLHRQDVTKHDGQQRWIRLPHFAAAVIERLIVNHIPNPGPNPDDLLVVSERGAPVEKVWLAAQLQQFRLAHREQLSEAGIDVDHLTFKAFRKTVAAAIDDGLGIDAAAELLGHAHPATTRGHYAKRKAPVVRAAADALEERFGEIA